MVCSGWEGVSRSCWCRLPASAPVRSAGADHGVSRPEVRLGTGHCVRPLVSDISVTWWTRTVVSLPCIPETPAQAMIVQTQFLSALQDVCLDIAARSKTNPGTSTIRNATRRRHPESWQWLPSLRSSCLVCSSSHPVTCSINPSN